MKKLLVLILVLAMTSLAGAGLQTLTQGLDVNVDTDLKTITFIGTSAAAGNPDSVISLSLGVMTPDAGGVDWVSTSSNFPTGGAGMEGSDLGYPEGSWAAFSAVDTSGTGRIGMIAVFSYEGDPSRVVLSNEEIIGLGNSEVSFRDGTIISLAGMEIIIPEPASMLLLGLGGLFLRRK